MQQVQKCCIEKCPFADVSALDRESSKAELVKWNLRNSFSKKISEYAKRIEQFESKSM